MAVRRHVPENLYDKNGPVPIAGARCSGVQRAGRTGLAALAGFPAGVARRTTRRADEAAGLRGVRDGRGLCSF